jgi:hypothetical protein
MTAEMTDQETLRLLLADEQTGQKLDAPLSSLLVNENRTTSDDR